MAVTIGSPKVKTIADPIPSYESIVPLWKKSRAICNGERYIKDYDLNLDVNSFSNLLIPFSASMTPQQYNFYKAEAELPGIVSQFAKTLIGGLLRKQPQLTLPDGLPEEAYSWIRDAFGQDNSPLSAFLDKALWEELQTSRCWIYVDYPKVPNGEQLTTQDFLKYKPYPTIWNAESVINWTLSVDDFGTQVLSRVITRQYIERMGENEWHPDVVDTIKVHELVNGYYQIRIYEKQVQDNNVQVVNGQTQQVYPVGNSSGQFVLVDTITNIMANGERLTIIPAWPLNGSIDVVEPMLTPLIDREVGLYNKISRRNHLLYGAATYTPVICSNMTDEQFDQVVGAGLGSWLHLQQGDTATVLETPTSALQDMAAAIASTLEEMAKMGVRMLAPENMQSGVALELRNAAQTAQLGTLNTKVSNTMSDVISFMLNWRYDLDTKASDIQFQLSTDFDATPLGADWLRLATEWYQQGLIPRTVWLQLLKSNDIVPTEYDDEEGQAEIAQDENVITPVDQMNYAQQQQEQQMVLQQQQMEQAAQAATKAPTKPNPKGSK